MLVYALYLLSSRIKNNLMSSNDFENHTKSYTNRGEYQNRTSGITLKEGLFTLSPEDIKSKK